jgi:hypothetical protein
MHIPCHNLMQINYKEKKDNTHFIGVPILDNYQYIMNYTYSYTTLIDHLTRNYPTKLHENLDIMYLIKDKSDVYYVILKTFWLRIIQRKWRQTLKERKEIRMRRCNPNEQYLYLISYRYKYKYNVSSHRLP